MLNYCYDAQRSMHLHASEESLLKRGSAEQTQVEYYYYSAQSRLFFSTIFKQSFLKQQSSQSKLCSKEVRTRTFIIFMQF